MLSLHGDHIDAIGNDEDGECCKSPFCPLLPPRSHRVVLSARHRNSNHRGLHHLHQFLHLLGILSNRFLLIREDLLYKLTLNSPIIGIAPTSPLCAMV